MYKHTQCVPPGVLTTFGTIAGLSSLVVPRALRAFTGISLGGALFTFRSMTVTIDESDITLEFGNWLKIKKIPLHEIESSSIERMHPLQGWGIHFVGEGWLYNVYGLDAVKVTLKNGEKIFIGSDEAEELDSSIKSAIAAS